MQSLRLLQEATASTSDRLRSAWPLHPLTNSSSSGCHRMAGACSPGLRCHGRLARVEAVSAAINSPLTSSAPPRTWCTQCMRMMHSSSSTLLLRCRPEQQRIRTEAIDADTTDHFRASGWRWAESDLQSLAQLATGGSCVDARPTPVGMAAASAHQQQLCWLPSHGKDSRTSLPRPRRLACVEAVSAAISSPVTSSAPPCM